MDDLAHINKLKEEQSKVLKENEAAQQSRTKIRAEYLTLKKKLTSLPNTISQPTMVPIGNVGFFPGKLVHTNEIMVLLGDNWFAERSSKQACEIVDRRIALVDSQLNDLNKEFENMKSHHQFAEQFQQMSLEHDGVQEIKETVPDDYQQSQSKGKSRKAHVPKHNRTQRNVEFKTEREVVENLRQDLRTEASSDSTIDHDELFARLNQLEKEELEAEELEHQERMNGIYQANDVFDNSQDDRPEYGAQLNRAEGNNNPSYTNSKTKLRANVCTTNASFDSVLDDMQSTRRVQFESDIHGSNDFDGGGNEENVILFSHTNNILHGRSASESDLMATQRFNSPADIFEHFSAKSNADGRQLKSILKKDSRSNSNENLKLRPILKSSPEHRPGTPENSLDEPKPILKTPPDTQESDRRPGTPEYVLDDEPKPILKLHSDISDVKHSKQEVHFCDSDNYIVDYESEETRSILKTSAENSSQRIHGFDDEHKSILKQEHPKTILKSPEATRANKVNDVIIEPKPILKHYGAEAFSGRIIERDSNLPSQLRPNEEENNKRKPLSRFKASRRGK